MPHQSKEQGVRGRINRRRMLGLVTGVFGMAAGSDGARAADISPRATCSWRLVSSWCANGMTQEYWVFYCCDVFGCENVRYERRTSGAC